MFVLVQCGLVFIYFLENIDSQCVGLFLLFFSLKLGTIHVSKSTTACVNIMHLFLSTKLNSASMAASLANRISLKIKMRLRK